MFVLGIDVATQSLKAVLIRVGCRSSSCNDDDARSHPSTTDSISKHDWSEISTSLAKEYVVQYDPLGFGMTDGFRRHEDGRTVTAPVDMWVHALDVLFKNMADDGFPINQIVAIGGSAQQHTAVYWRLGASDRLQSLDPSASLRSQLCDDRAPCFVRRDCPIWMDMSTTAECRRLEDIVGGPNQLADLTGSCAYERFTLNQIVKWAVDNPDDYSQCERISLLSSFLPSVLAGTYAPADVSDASGMNAMNIRTSTWEARILNGVGLAHLSEKLGPICTLSSSHDGSRSINDTGIVGPISSYFVRRFGFNPQCQVMLATGDNPASLINLGLCKNGDIGISLGTSDTMFALLDDPKPSVRGHILASPIPPVVPVSSAESNGDESTLSYSDSSSTTSPGSHMMMLCCSNASLHRHALATAVHEFLSSPVSSDVVGRGAHDHESVWKSYEFALQQCPPGADGFIGFYCDVQHEILPSIARSGSFRFQPTMDFAPIAAFPTVFHDVRVALESRLLVFRIVSSELGLAHISRVFVTGGGSGNHSILQTIADVFQVPVIARKMTSGAAEGGAMRALYSYINDGGARNSTGPMSFDEFLSRIVRPVAADAVQSSESEVSTVSETVVQPRAEFASVYEQLAARYRTVLDREPWNCV